MYFDIGGWWLTCDHMFRRFGTPFAADWIAKNINGYLYTAAIPALPGTLVEGVEMGNRYAPRTPVEDPGYPEKIGAYLDAVLPTYGANFADWWTKRLVPEMKRNFEYLEDKIEGWEEIPLMEWATILEDAIDIHDRHWKIHWMLNFSQLSATLALQAAVAELKPDADPNLLGRLQSSASDRNWDSIEAFWKMKNEVAGDDELGAIFGKETGGDILNALGASEPGPTFRLGATSPLSEGVRLARGLEPRVRLPDPVRAGRADPRGHQGLCRNRLRLPLRDRDSQGRPRKGGRMSCSRARG